MTADPKNRLCRAEYWYGADHYQPNGNGDGDRRETAFAKGLPHDADGVPLAEPFADFVAAAAGNDPSALDAVMLASEESRRLVSPKAGFARELIGGDPDHYCIPPAPAYASKEEVAEIVENYWMALLRDVPFTDYAGAPASGPTAEEKKEVERGRELVEMAVEDICAVVDAAPDTQVPKPTKETLFRGATAGECVGPYLSQFMLLPTPFGAETIDRRMRTTAPKVDHMTDWSSWLAVQRGAHQPAPAYDPTRRYMRNGRDLSEWVHVDQLYQAYFTACLILLSYQKPGRTGSTPAFASNLPYVADAQGKNQDGFATFGGAHILSLVTEVSTRALKAVWRQKWRIHRRLRPEVFAGRIHAHRVLGKPDHGIRYDTLAKAKHLGKWAEGRNGWLLPMAFPEGSPVHPAYGAGHATVAGACTTILKAWFDCGTRMVDLMDPATRSPLAPVVASRDGLALVPYAGADVGKLTIEGELNKVAANVGIGRNIAGVHWRTDHTASIGLGERVALHTLWDYAASFAESGVEFKVPTFSHGLVTVSASGITDEKGKRDLESGATGPAGCCHPAKPDAPVAYDDRAPHVIKAAE